MLLARYRHFKKPLHLFARRTYAKRGPLTLRPETLTAIRPPPIDFSNQLARSVHKIPLYYSASESLGTKGRRNFPEGTKGFLYYHSGPNEPAGQIRLRICDDVSSFDSGHDLLVDGLRPWGLHLINLLRSSRYQPLVDIIVKDGFVSSHRVDNLRARLADTGTRRMRHILYALSDPFYIQLELSTHVLLRTISEQHTSEHYLRYLFSTTPSTWHRKKPEPVVSPFTGTLKVRLELSKLPEHASLGPTLVLKILEAHNVRHVREDITIVKKPVAGEYHHRFPHNKATMWCLCIDKVQGAREAFGPLLDMPGIVYAE